MPTSKLHNTQQTYLSLYGKWNLELGSLSTALNVKIDPTHLNKKKINFLTKYEKKFNNYRDEC